MDNSVIEVGGYMVVCDSELEKISVTTFEDVPEVNCIPQAVFLRYEDALHYMGSQVAQRDEALGLLGYEGVYDANVLFELMMEKKGMQDLDDVLYDSFCSLIKENPLLGKYSFRIVDIPLFV